jgi:NitT/TauT family transport system substrate-binding protein
MQFTRARALTLAAGGAAAVFAPNVVRAQTPVIRIGQNANDAFGEGYYSAEQGYFSAAGLNVEITTFANGAAQAAACAGGTIDVGLGEATELANGIIRGLPFAVFAGGVIYDSAAQIQALVVAPDSTIRSAKDFEGQAIAVPALVSISSMAVKQWLVKNGADLTKVKFVELSQPAMSPAVVRGTIAGAHIGEPFLSGAGGTIRKVAIPAESIAKSYLINEWFATRDWLAANAAAARKLAGVIYDTARWANAHQNESAVILSKYTKIDVDKIRSMARARYATTLQPQLIQPVLDMAFTYGGLPRHVDASEMIGRS